MAVRIQVRRDPAAVWTAANTVLAAGEPAYETDTGKQKIGDGSTPWVALPYEVDRAQVAVIQESPLNIRYPEYGAYSDGENHPLADDFASLGAAQAIYPFVTSLSQQRDWAALQKAANALPDPGGSNPANGGEILALGCSICDEPVALKSNATVDGVGGVAGGGGIGGTPFAGSVIVYTGAADRFIDARATYAVTLKNLQIYYNNASFTGFLVDFGQPPSLLVSSSMTLRNVALESGNLQTAQLLNLDEAVSGQFWGCKFAGGAYGVRGKAQGEPAHQSNAHSFYGCLFAAQRYLHVINANEAWTFTGCIFEQLYDPGGVSAGAGAYSQEAGMTTWGLAFNGCWFGDATQVGSWISSNGEAIYGLTISGGAMGPADTHVNLSGSTGAGVEITGVEMIGAFNALNVTGGGITDIVFRPAYCGPGVIPLVGVPGARSVVQYDNSTPGGTAPSASFDGVLGGDALLLKTSITAASAPNNSIFCDSADGVIKVKNGVGVATPI